MRRQAQEERKLLFIFFVIAQVVAQIGDQQTKAGKQRCHHQNRAQGLDLWAETAHQQKGTTEDGYDAVKSVEILLLVLIAPAAAGAIVQVPDAPV